mmetsp:Transcript_10968/g.32261  ORF Transcript_10968/g.32261 Transcript_10968/m.32261 type:complete len:229 (-) Transcript_10968:1292-1978(-)
MTVAWEHDRDRSLSHRLTVCTLRAAHESDSSPMNVRCNSSEEARSRARRLRALSAALERDGLHGMWLLIREQGDEGVDVVARIFRRALRSSGTIPNFSMIFRAASSLPGAASHSFCFSLSNPIITISTSVSSSSVLHTSSSASRSRCVGIPHVTCSKSSWTHEARSHLSRFPGGPRLGGRQPGSASSSAPSSSTSTSLSHSLRTLSKASMSIAMRNCETIRMSVTVDR